MGKIIQGNFGAGSSNSLNCTVILAAAGCGSRMALGFNKIFLSIEDKPVISYSIELFESIYEIKNIIIVASKDDIPLINDIVHEFGYKKVKNIICGGATRQESVLNGLVAMRLAHLSQKVLFCSLSKLPTRQVLLLAEFMQLTL